ncbi:MAG: ParB/RepB/Spo0J family partition protein [Erysipelotrichaceae bacterium]|jgi:ParB-like chromosome segregation protein Spo0J|nr:ParB N-terminal domain-containing protein [Lactimicrobium massiliense]MCH4020111.1 ParB/RepB/Spo0J family partition protein [Erysipelotrichaceae bacterium]MCI1325833.1 ParB/RepB/Spo0J family partition protein [Solobacterium sp.]MCH4044894.1 ParB/RepB/Spo0J family partition protein [Erysipelotrichaceae bacterium]MCH4122106.1 ParB/RepB/Spo0J family partition protein [Erysipelotrichaceae bacterium]MCI1362632.1 ParB/RepB/Spo0J family partition protein [Solobacterium sp.]
MINTIVNLDEIQYEYQDPGNLTESIRTHGMAIAVQVNVTEHGYVCVDGRRRLSACAILAKQDPKFSRIPVVLMNDYSRAGSSFWGNTQNLH